MSKTTPEKIADSLDFIEKDLLDLTRLSDELDSVKSQILQVLANSLDRFESVPIERLRTIRPMIESVQSSRDQLIDASSRLEDFFKCVNDLQCSIDQLRRYYDEQYLASVRKRENRDR